MPYIGIVAKNGKHGDEEPPYMGCIKVVCHHLFGTQRGVDPELSNTEKLAYGILSPWIFPVYNSPSDFILPDLGDNVLIEEIIGTGQYVYRGTLPRMMEDNVMLSDTKMEMLPLNAEVTVDEFKTRVIGDKNGSAIVFYDSWIQDRKNNDGARVEKFKIVVGGKNNLNEDRKGVEIEIDSTTDEEIITILAQNSDGSNAQSIVLNNKKDAGFIELLDYHGQSIAIDSENELIQIVDKEGQQVLLDAGKGEVTIEDKNSNKILLSSDGVVVDASSNNVEVNAMDVTVNADGEVSISANRGVTVTKGAQTIEMGDASIKLTGNAGSVEIM